MTSATIDPCHLMSGKHSRITEPREIIVATSIVKPGMKSALENLILTSKKVKDREKALEILASIEDHNNRFNYKNNLVKEYKLKAALKRPKTACSKIKGNVSFNPFSTAYSEDYPKKMIKETTATRPSSTENIVARPTKTSEKDSEMKDNEDACNQVQPEKSFKSLSIYDEHSTYKNDYCSDDRTKNSDVKFIPPYRSATGSGDRCHNPHPNKEFLVWRFPRESGSKEKRIPSATALKVNMEDNFAQITDDQFNRVIRGHCRSTYQTDYLGGTTPIDQITPFYLHPEIKTGQKLKMSTQQVDFIRPTSLPLELCVPKNRYSSNKIMHQSAKGIIPHVTNKMYMNTFARTTYDEEINDRAHIIHGEIVNNIQKKVDLNRLHNMKDLERAIMQNGSHPDTEILNRVYQKINEPEDFRRISFVRKPFNNNGQLSWISSYCGPL